MFTNLPIHLQHRTGVIAVFCVNLQIDRTANKRTPRLRTGLVLQIQEL